MSTETTPLPACYQPAAPATAYQLFLVGLGHEVGQGLSQQPALSAHTLSPAREAAAWLTRIRTKP